jgi:preprotein translocase subunit SecE
MRLRAFACRDVSPCLHKCAKQANASGASAFGSVRSGDTVFYYRYVVLLVAVIDIFVGVTLRAGLTSGFAQFGVPDDLVLGLANVSTLTSAGVSVVAFAVALRSVSLLTFLDEVLAEVMRVTWPTRDEAVRAASTVILTASFMAVVISLYDLVWKNLADMFLFNPS